VDLGKKPSAQLVRQPNEGAPAPFNWAGPPPPRQGGRVPRPRFAAGGLEGHRWPGTGHTAQANSTGIHVKSRLWGLRLQREDGIQSHPRARETRMPV